MNILWVDLEPRWRGGQNQALLALEGLRARGHSAELLAREDGALAGRARARAIPVHGVGRGAPRWSAARRLRRLLAERRIDLVHANEAHALTAAWLARVHRQVPLVAARRVVFPLQKSALALARYRAAQRIIAISHRVADVVLATGLPRERVEVVYDGVDVPPPFSEEARHAARQRWGVLANEPLLGCAGSLEPQKGQELAVRALASLRARGSKSRLLLAGEGPGRAPLEQLARELRVEDAVVFAGFVEDVGQVYAALDVFLFPARAEGLGSALLEAMAAGLPCIALAGGAAPEIIEDGVSGLLASPGSPADNANGIAAAVERLLQDPALAQRLGRAARHRVEEQFSTDRMVEETLRVYRAVLAEATRA